MAGHQTCLAERFALTDGSYLQIDDARQTAVIASTMLA